MRKLAVLFVIALVVGAMVLFVHRRQRALDAELIRASFNLETARVAELIKSGANPNARYENSGREYFKGSDGGYPIACDRWVALIALAHSDATGDSVALATLLIGAGADINANDGYGNTALAECCYQNRESLALFLLERGANPNTRTRIYIDGTGNVAPVHRATQNPIILRALIKSGADVNPLDDTGASPLDWAARYNNQEAIQILTSAGARGGQPSNDHLNGK